MFKIFEYKDKKLSILPALSSKRIKGFFIVSIVAIVITSLSGWLKFEEKDLWKIYNLLLQQFNLKQELPDLRDNQKKLEAEIELEVDQAIDDYWRQSGLSKAEVSKPRYIEEKNDENLCYSDECKALAPPMRLCAPWLDTCPSPVVE
jgi:hypothetical protein